MGSRTVVGASVRGTSHVRDGRPNQDALCWYPESGCGANLVVAVSDGHGSPRCFRSDVGSSIAVSVSVDVGRELLATTPGPPASIQDRAGGTVTAEIVDRWTRHVTQAIEARPFTAEELADVERAGPLGRHAVDENPLLAYGATLLLAVVSDASALFVQLGDGDILTVGPDGRTTRPLATDTRLFANETTSLCMPGAAGEFRIGARPLLDDGLRVILLATDGFANAYPDDESFLEVGPDLVAHVRDEGLRAVSDRLEGWLGQAARHSGDDVTAAVVWFGSA